MALRPIHLLGSAVLRQPSDPVGKVDQGVRELVRDLFETMEADSGVGLAANQIGIARRVAVVEADGQRVILIDPEIVEREGKVTGEEGCLSIPEIFADVERAARVVVETTSLDNERVRVEVTELASRAVQHEIDHLNGVLFLDHLSPLKRRMLLKKWRKLRQGESGHIKEIGPKPKQSARL